MSNESNTSFTLPQYGGMHVSPAKEYSQQCNGLTTSHKRCKRISSNNQQYCSIHAPMYKYDCPSDCSICFEAIDVNKTRPTLCGHYIHAECLQQWYNTRHTTCPVCRTTLISSKPPTKCELILQTPNVTVTIEEMMQAFQNMLQVLRTQNMLTVGSTSPS